MKNEPATGSPPTPQAPAVATKTGRPLPPATGRWVKGQTGNPHGRPKTAHVSKAYRRLGAMTPEEFKKYKPRNVYEMKAAEMLRVQGKALVPAVIEFTNRVEGPVPRPAEDVPTINLNQYSVNVTFGPRGADIELGGNGNGHQPPALPPAPDEGEG